MLLLRAPIEKVELEPHKPERVEKRGREGGSKREGQRKPGSVILGTCTGKTKKRKDERDASGKL